jgi:hypothetical protein
MHEGKEVIVQKVVFVHMLDNSVAVVRKVT